jgi:hypothetical protein
MKAFLQRNHRLAFYSAWTILALIQSRYTVLLDDEAYYWVYSKFLSWGYFDHPPMVAVLIKIGYALFHNELGVRLLFVLLNVLTLVLIETIIDKKNIFLFYVIVLSLAVLQVSGFSAVPDTPLIFFTALFFWCYKRFVKDASLQNSFILGLVTAGLLYSKYHAVLIIFFVLLSNLKLLSRYQTYIAALTALLLFSPHLWWQYQHQWVSFRYHLFESNVNPYKISYTLEYLAGQILLAGPIAGVFLLPAAFLYRTKDVFERGLKLTLAGIYIFFLLSSFRGKVEANWTSPSIVPLIILSHYFFADNATAIAKGLQRWLFRLLPITLALVLVARIAMMVDVLPVNEIKNRYHSWHDWPQEMKAKTGALPVVFGNSYQRASKYWFYSGQMTYSLNSYNERRNNYYFWPIEDSLLGKPAFIYDIYNLDSFSQRIQTDIGTLGYKYDSSFVSFAKVQLKPTTTTYHTSQGQPLHLTCAVAMPNHYRVFLKDHPNIDAKIFVAVFNSSGWLENIPIARSIYELSLLNLNIEVQYPLPPGKYFMIFSIYVTGTLTSPHNSEKIGLIVQ